MTNKTKEQDFERDFSRSVTVLDRRRRKFMNEKLREYGLCGAMYSIVLHVARNPGATQDSIAGHMLFDKGNLARRVKQLEELSYLRRETDRNDRRQNNLFLTLQGEALLPKIEAALSQWAQSTVAVLTPEERETLHALLTKTVSSIQQQ